MNKLELISAVTDKVDLKKKDVEQVVNALLSTVQESLSAGEKVQLVNFGTFDVRERAERTGVNPRSGKQIKIPAATVPVFKPGKALKDSVNE